MTFALLLLFFVTEYVRPTSYFPALLVLHLNSLVPLGAFVGTTIKAGPAVIQRLAGETSTRIMIGLMSLIWIAFVTSDVQEYVMNAHTTLLGFVLIYWAMASEVVSVGRVKGVIATLIVVHLIVAALNPVLFTEPQTRHYVSSGAFLGDGNDLALSLDIIIPLCLYLLLDARKRLHKLLWLGALLVLVAGVVSTQSRGGTLGLAAVGIYWWWRSQRKFQTAALATVIVVLILALAPGAYFDRMSSIGDTQEGSAQGRITAWRVATRMALDSPLFGVGPAHFGVKFGTEYRPPDFVGSGMNAHSLYFLALGELGFPGLILIVWLIGHNLAANRRLAQQVRARNTPTADGDLQLLAAGSGAMIALATAGAFLSALWYPHLYVVAGLLTAIRRVVTLHTEAAATSREVESSQPQMTLHWSLRPRPSATTARIAGVRR